jgi:hypothetical protein
MTLVFMMVPRGDQKGQVPGATQTVVLPSFEKSQQTMPPLQVLGETMHPVTMQALAWVVSQTLASNPAHWACVVHDMPTPVGGRLQNGAGSQVAQTHPLSQPAVLVQGLVQ